MNKVPKRLFVFLFLAALAVSFLFYRSSLNYYFFQDDFFHLNISRASNLKEFLSFLSFRNDIVGYRPIGIQLYFFSLHKLFGLNPAGFRVIAFSALFSSSFFLIVIFKRISGKVQVGLLTAILWVTSSIHFTTISWISAGYIILGTFLYLLTSYSFLKFVDERKIRYYLLAIFSFTICLATYEFAITWPIVFGYYFYFVLRSPIKKSVKIFTPFLFLLFIYLLSRFLFKSTPSIIEYKMVFDFFSIKTLFWYFLWTFNIPEEFKKQVVKNLIIFNPQFTWEYWNLILTTLVGAVWVFYLGLCLPFFYILKNKLNLNYRLLSFAIFWFLVSISPVLFLPNHTFVEYLGLPSIGIYFAISYLVIKSNKLFLILPIILIWLITSFSTLNFYKANSYIVEAQKVASRLSIYLKKVYPKLPPNSVVYYQFDGVAQRQAVMNQEIIKAIYNDPTLSIYYNRDELKSFLEKQQKPVFIYGK